jgi:hypothetical protein
VNRKKWIYNTSLLAGLIFFALAVRLFFRNDINGTVIHIALALILFIAALLTGRNDKDEQGGDS